MKKLLFILIITLISCNGDDNNTNNNEIDSWNEFYVDPGSLKMKFPKSYDLSEVNYGDDTWYFSKRRDDEKVVFDMEQGPGTMYIPEILESPLPDTPFSYPDDDIIYTNSEKIYSYYDLNTEIGVLNFYDNGFPFRNQEGVFLKKENTLYTEVLFVSFTLSELDEVKLILSTTSLEE